MPLVHSSSPKALKQNIRTLMGDVGNSPKIQTRKQALAIAFETQRRARASGGVVPGYDFGGAVDPTQQQQMPPPPGVAPLQMPGNAPAGVPGAQMWPPQPQGMNPAPPPAPGQMPGQPPGQWASGVAQNAAPPANPQNAPPIPPNAAPAEQPMGKQLMANGGAAPHFASGGFSMAKAPHLDSGWQTRSEAKAMHTGPILSAVPGRTDAHSMHVPSGSYVIPADIVSGRGQGNTIAGSNFMQKMFRMGPYGSPSLSMKRGIGAPRPPKPMGVMRAAGGQANGNVGAPTPVMLAGGEVVVPPENLMDVVHPDLDYAHQIMDAWILDERKNLRKTLAKLPGPVRD